MAPLQLRRLPLLQPKLRIGALNDPLEREADNVADQVMRMNLTNVLSSGPQQIQRKCATCEKEEQEAASAAPLRISRKCAHCYEEEKTIQKKSGTSSSSAQSLHSEARPLVHSVLRSPGQPLADDDLAFFTPRFGFDFSRVRIHTDDTAAESAYSVNALAYTSGSNIAFAAGHYQPCMDTGRRLLAHELAHVVQQAGGSTVEAVQRQPEANAADAKKDAKLHRMARRPGEALTAWKTLKEGDRDSILWIMADMYGADFESEFLKFANGEKKDNISTTIANKSQFSPEQLTNRGYRRADAGTPEIWVHPSGHEYQLIQTSTAPDPPTEERCIEPCKGTSDEESCNECCDEKIPESDLRCRVMCHSPCFTK
jgi:hypothetical protein